MAKIMNATTCLACLGLMMATTRVRADDTLLPAPREIRYGQGVCALAPGSFIWVDTSGSHRLLPIAGDVPCRQLAEVPDGYQHSLCATDPRSIEFLAGLYDELLPNFSSRQVNVACDETFDLGSGRSKEICEQMGKGRVYLDFVKEIHRLVASHGRTMQMWGDIVMMHPELISELPDGIIVLEWGYRAEHPFDAHCEKFARAGVPFYVCPGTSTWNTFAGRTGNAMANLRNAAGNGRKHGAIGFLNTNWGDHGHTHPLSACYPGFAYGAGLEGIIAEYKRLWLARSRPGGLPDSVAHFAPLLNLYHAE